MNKPRTLYSFLLAACCLLAMSVLSAYGDVTRPPEGVENLLSGGEWIVTWGNGFEMEDESTIRLNNWTQLHYSKSIKVEPGYKYCFYAEVRIKDFYFLKNNHYGFGFGLEQLRKGKDRNGNWYEMYAYGVYREGTLEEWKPTGGSWIPRETSVWLQPGILIKSDENSQAWYRNIIVWKEPLPKKEILREMNLVENASFEIIYGGAGATPFGYWLYSPSGSREEFGALAEATREKSALHASSVKFLHPCRLVSPSTQLEKSDMTVSAQVLSEGAPKGQSFQVSVIFQDAQGETISELLVGETDGTDGAWQTVGRKLAAEDLPEGAVMGKLALALNGDGDAVWYADDLRMTVVNTMKGLPFRPMNTEKANVTVDVSNTGKIFKNPLDAYDHHCADRLLSYSIGTAGPHLEGPGRWFEERKNLGINYVRIHNGFDYSSLCEHRAVSEVGVDYFKPWGWNDGEQGVVFGKTRLNPETGEPFPKMITLENGTLKTDFTGIKYLLDNSILKGGCRPIFGLEPVPISLATNHDTHQPPYDMGLWQEFITQFFQFLVDNYGEDEIRQWIFETGNEPSTEWTFHGRGDRSNVLNDFLEMQDYTIAGAQAVLPDVFIAGPSGPPASFFVPMLNHASEQPNYATGKVGDTKLDAISYHGYMGATPIDLSWRSNEEFVFSIARIRDDYERKTGRRLQLWNTEFAPIYLETTPKNPPVGAYDNHIQAVATLHMSNYSYNAGVERMAFFYAAPIYFAPVRGDHDFKKAPNQKDTPEFLGEPTVHTFHGVFKPVTRIMQMLSWLNGGRVLQPQVDAEPIYAMGVKDGDTVKLVVYSYDLDPTQDYSTEVAVELQGMKPNASYKVTRYELSATKANSWYLATRDGITQKMCEDDIAVVDRLNRESELQPETSEANSDADGNLSTTITMPTMSASLLVFEEL